MAENGHFSENVAKFRQFSKKISIFVNEISMLLNAKGGLQIWAKVTKNDQKTCNFAIF